MKNHFGHKFLFCMSGRKCCSKFSSASWEDTSCWFRSSIVCREYSCRVPIANLVDLSCCRSPFVTSRKLRCESSNSSFEDRRSLFFSRIEARKSLLTAANLASLFFISSKTASDKNSWLFFPSSGLFLLADPIFLGDLLGLCFSLY